jgi:hypothetical protein
LTKKTDLKKGKETWERGGTREGKFSKQWQQQQQQNTGSSCNKKRTARAAQTKNGAD